MAQGLGTRMMRFVEQGCRAQHWTWKGPRDRHGKPMSFATKSKVNLDPAEAIYKKYRKTKKRTGGNGKLVRHCGVDDCMNPWHIEFVNHKTSQLLGATKHKLAERKSEAFVFTLHYLRFADTHENKVYGQAAVAQRTKEASVVVPPPNCPTCNWPEPICACFQPD